MLSDAERMARAGEYVLGRMSDAERERAERDLETDERFRAAVVAVAERMRYFGSGGGSPARALAAETLWSGLAERLASLPHMQGVPVSGTVSRAAPLVFTGKPEPVRKAAGSAAVARSDPFWRRMGRALFRPLRGEASAPQAAAVLEAAAVGPCAIVEVYDKGRLRLLLLGEWALGPNEQLSLWGLCDDGATTRLGGFSQSGQIRLEHSPITRFTAFQLGREHISFVPADRPGAPPLAEGRVRPLAGTPGARSAGGFPDPLAATGR